MRYVIFYIVYLLNSLLPIIAYADIAIVNSSAIRNRPQGLMSITTRQAQYKLIITLYSCSRILRLCPQRPSLSLCRIIMSSSGSEPNPWANAKPDDYAATFKVGFGWSLNVLVLRSYVL
jgi:hypothetical protein